MKQTIEDFASSLKLEQGSPKLWGQGTYTWSIDSWSVPKQLPLSEAKGGLSDSRPFTIRSAEFQITFQESCFLFLTDSLLDPETKKL